MSAVVDARTLSRLRWRCRRGLLENDLFIERFFDRHGDAITVEQAGALMSLMDLPDNDLLDLLLSRAEPDAELARPAVTALLLQMRAAPARRPPSSEPQPPRVSP